MPSLSVIIPAYNRERTLAATVESVLACGKSAEIIVVDDGSTDSTVAVAHAFGSRIQVIEQQNSGPSIARNNGFAHSTGDVVAFLDSDDLLLPDVIPDCLRAFSDHPEIDVLFCDTLFGNESTGTDYSGRCRGVGVFEQLLTNRLGQDLFALERNAFVTAMIDRNQVFLGSALFRRETLQAGEGFDPELFGGEDYELLPALYRHAPVRILHPTAGPVREAFRWIIGDPRSNGPRVCPGGVEVRGSGSHNTRGTTQRVRKIQGSGFWIRISCL